MNGVPRTTPEQIAEIVSCARKEYARVTARRLGISATHVIRIQKANNCAGRVPENVRFYSYVDRSAGPSSCHPWTGGTCADGYGNFALKRKPVGAHRVAWELAYGPIPDGKHVLHSCDNPPCCNELHLFLGTNVDNVADRVRKGRSGHRVAKGENSPHAKLTDLEVSAIRRLKGTERQKDTASRYGVSQGLLSLIQTGKLRAGDDYGHK